MYKMTKSVQSIIVLHIVNTWYLVQFGDLMKKRRVMLDGALAGAELIGDIDVKSSEVAKIRRVLLENGAEEREGGLSVTVLGKSAMVVSLRTHYHNKNKFFLNISGNPLTFLTGNNTYGYAEADRIMVAAYTQALEALAGVPTRVMKAIAAADINIHSLEFATYTNKVTNKGQLLNDWAHVYRTAYSSINGTSHETLADMLNLRFARAHRDHTSSICLRILSRDGREEEAMLTCYDKALEIADRARQSGTVAVVPGDIKDRIRLDLALNQGWFRRRQVNGRKLKTLKDLVDYVEKKHAKSWPRFLKAEFKWAVDRTKLFYMWSFDAQEALAKSDLIDNAMLKARALIRGTDKQWNAYLAKGRRVPIVLDPHPEDLYLDMRVVD